MADELHQQALAYLDQHRVMTLATSGVDGVWAAAVFYVNVGFNLYFLSAARTRHAQQIRQNPQVAVTIQEDYADWPSIQGIQCAGIVTLLEGRAREEAIRHYRAKYPFLRQAPAQIASAFARISWYGLRPQRLYLIDNSKGFGHRDEIDVSQ